MLAVKPNWIPWRVNRSIRDVHRRFLLKPAVGRPPPVKRLQHRP